MPGVLLHLASGVRVEVVAVPAAVVSSPFGRQSPHIQLHLLLV
ncbi:MAG: hypothetical protein WBG24_03490 [Syntrophobacteria bacterium]|nr:hypothetical protein [Deltaproteobacteria bacterium]MDH3951847.1 hypothetical protein [Deltaproteobacteria bacterium]